MMATYADKLRDPRWQKKRLEIMERDGFACRECGDKASTLNVHHGYYARGRSPWEYPDEHLKTLCEDCHRKYESAREVILADLVQMSIAQQAALYGAMQSVSALVEFGRISARVIGVNANSIHDGEPSDEAEGTLATLLNAAIAAIKSSDGGSRDYANLIYLMHNWWPLQFAIRGIVETSSAEKEAREIENAHLSVEEIEQLLMYAKNRDAIRKESVS